MATWKEGVAYRYLAAGLVLTSLVFSACGDDDDDDGGGTAGSSGASTAGKGGNAAAGKGTTAGSSNGGSASGAGSATGGAGAGQGGAGGDTGQAGSTAAGNGGAATTAGAGGNDGGSAGATQGGSGGSEPLAIEYRACEQATALNRIAVHRIDEDAGTCTRVVLLQGSNCSLGVAAGGWCLEQGLLSADVAACKALMVPAAAKMASSASGSISVTGSTADVNVTLAFPAGGGLPTSITVAADDCAADCMMNDCRP